MSVIPQSRNPQSLGGVRPSPGPAGDLKRSPDPSPTHAPPPNPKSWIRPCNCSVVEVFVTCGFILVLMFPPLPIKLSRYTKNVTNVVESVCDMRQVGGFLLVFWFLNLQSCHDITVMLLKVFVILT